MDSRGKYPRIRGAAASRSPEYKAWRAMHARCHDAKHPAFRWYGGRGIKVAARWSSFWLFVEDMGLRPSAAHSLDRVNNDGDYEPANCRWANAFEQQTNRGNNRKVAFNGRSLSLSEIARIANMDPSTIAQRVDRGAADSRLTRRPETGPYGGKLRVLAGEEATLPQLARRAGVPISTLKDRLKRGLGLAEALAPKETLADHCRRHGKPFALVHDRLRRGWNLQRALTEPPRNATAKRDRRTI